MLLDQKFNRSPTEVPDLIVKAEVPHWGAEYELKSRRINQNSGSMNEIWSDYELLL